MFVIHYYINNQMLDSYLHTKSEKIWLLFTFVLNWVFLRFPWQRQAIWNFQASKPFIHMPYNISIRFHPIPSTLNCSRFCGNGGHSEISKPQNYVCTCQTKILVSIIQFRALWKILCFFLWFPWQRRPFWKFRK